LRIRDVIQFNPIVLALLLITVFIKDECFRVGKNDEGIKRLRFKIYLNLDLDRFD